MATRANRPGFELRLTRERIFYIGMALMISGAVLVGFGPSWFFRGSWPTARPLDPLTPLIILHGVTFTAWMVLFVMQAGLISARQHKLHMRLGIATIGLAVVIVVLGLLTSAWQAELGTGPKSLHPLTWFAVPFFSMASFAVLVSGGYYWRRDPQMHKRLMLCATAVMLQPAIGRMPIEALPLIGAETRVLIAFLLAAPLLVWDLVQRGRPHRGTVIGLGVLAGEQLLRAAVWQSEGWRAVAGQIVRALT